jgi:hypothetical protein
MLDSPPAIRFEQDSQHTNHGNAACRGHLTAAALIHEKKISAEIHRQPNSFRFSSIQSPGQLELGRLWKISDLQPSGPLLNPLPHNLWSCGVSEFLFNSPRNQDSAENVTHQIRPPDRNQIAQWRCIGNGRHRRELRLLARMIGEMSQDFGFALEFRRLLVVQINMLSQEILSLDA